MSGNGPGLGDLFGLGVALAANLAVGFGLGGSRAGPVRAGPVPPERAHRRLDASAGLAERQGRLARAAQAGAVDYGLSASRLRSLKLNALKGIAGGLEMGRSINFFALEATCWRASNGSKSYTKLLLVWEGGRARSSGARTRRPCGRDAAIRIPRGRKLTRSCGAVIVTWLKERKKCASGC